MTKDELILRFQGQSTETLEQTLEQLDAQLAQMVFVEDMQTILESKEVIETILKDREDGSK